MARMLETMAKMDAHHRLLLGFVVAAVVGLGLRAQALWMVSLAAYDAFAFATLGLIWVTVTLTPLEQIRAVAQRQDVGRTLVFIFVIILACAALFAVAGAKISRSDIGWQRVSSMKHPKCTYACVEQLPRDCAAENPVLPARS